LKLGEHGAEVNIRIEENTMLNKFLELGENDSDIDIRIKRTLC
jgi:hypothetical protein